MLEALFVVENLGKVGVFAVTLPDFHSFGLKVTIFCLQKVVVKKRRHPFLSSRAWLFLPSTPRDPRDPLWHRTLVVELNASKEPN